MPKRTVKKDQTIMQSSKKIKNKEEKTESLKTSIKDFIISLNSDSTKNSSLLVYCDLGKLLEELMEETGKVGKEWVDYVNSEFDRISCWAETQYVFSVKYPQENIEPDVKTEGLKMFYEIINSNLNPDYRYYVTHNSEYSKLKTLAERRLNRETTK
jgi:hypothetical protein